MSDFAPPPTAPQAVPLPPATPRRAAKNTVATVSLVLGIVAMVGNVLFIPGLVAFVLGIIGLVRSGRTTPPVGRGKAVTGIVLGVVSGVTGVFLTMAMFAPDTPAEQAAKVTADSAAPADDAADDTGADASDEADDAEPAVDEPAETEEPAVPLSDYDKLDAKKWDAIAKDPESAAGETVVVFAEVTQFDAATGTDAFRANVGAAQPSAEFELETNTVLTGDVSLLSGVVAGDVLKVHAVVVGPYDYETQIGGNTSVPLLAVAQVKDVGFKDLTKDAKLGDARGDGYGGTSVPVTVKNSGKQTFTYSVEVVAESNDGSESYGTGTAYAENLNSGQKAKVTADFYDIPGDAVFRVAAVERYDY